MWLAPVSRPVSAGLRRFFGRVPGVEDPRVQGGHTYKGLGSRVQGLGVRIYIYIYSERERDIYIYIYIYNERERERERERVTTPP